MPKYPTEGELLELVCIRLKIAKKREEMSKLKGISTSSFVVYGGSNRDAFKSKVERDALRRTKLEEDLQALFPVYRQKAEMLQKCICSDNWTDGQEWFLIDCFCFGTNEIKARRIAGLTVKEAIATKEEFLRRVRTDYDRSEETGRSPADTEEN